MPYSVVQTKGNTGTGTSLVTVLDSNTTTGNLILVQILLAFPVFSNISSVTDSQGNSYASVGSPQTLSNSQLLTYYAFNITGGTTPTVTANFTGSGQQNAVQMPCNSSGLPRPKKSGTSGNWPGIRKTSTGCCTRLPRQRCGNNDPAIHLPGLPQPAVMGCRIRP